MKSGFTKVELDVWDSVYGPSRGPSSGRMKILVEEFIRLGLAPVMMRVGDQMMTWDAHQFQTEIKAAFAQRADDHVQVYYHPADCERVVGSSSSNWTHWARLILETSGLILKGDETAALLVEDVPRLTLPGEALKMLQGRGLRTTLQCRLVSLRAVVFYLGAQYASWATPEEVSRVAPFKQVLSKLSFKVRECPVRRDTGLEDLLSSVAETPVPANVYPISPPVAASVPVAVEVGVPLADSAAAFLDDIQTGRLPNRLANPTVASPPLTEEQEIDARIVAARRELELLQKRKVEAQNRASAKRYTGAVISSATVDGNGQVQLLTLRFEDGTETTYQVRVHARDVDLLLEGIR